MNPAIEQLQARAIGTYTQQQPRERVIVVVGAAVLAVLIAYLGIWEPLVKAHHRNAEALEASRALAVRIEAAASLTQHSQGGANVDRHPALPSVVDQTIRHRPPHHDPTPAPPAGG